MWCVAELDEKYIRRMEDVLALYEKPWLESEPMVCIDEKPIVLHADLRPAFPHTRKAVVERFGERDGDWLWNRFTVHYTPKHGSRLNQAEIEISLFSRQCLGQRRIPSLGDLRREARAWNRRMNRDGVTIDWRFTRRKAGRKFGYKRNHITRSET
jgi:hypothetical protein